MIEYFKQNNSLYYGIYFVDIINSFFVKTDKTEIGYIAIRVLTKYVRDVYNNNTQFLGSKDQEVYMKSILGSKYPYTMSKKDFFIGLINYFPSIMEKKNCAILEMSHIRNEYKLYVNEIYKNHFQNDTEIKLKIDHFNSIYV